jgi:PilZ domain
VRRRPSPINTSVVTLVVAVGQEVCNVSYIEREHPRYAYDATISAMLSGRLIQGKAINVSRGGLCVLFAEPVPVGLEWNIDLALRFDHGAQSEAISLPSRVVWCTPIDDQYQVGISLLGVSAEVSSNLEMFLRFLDRDSIEK